MGSLAKCITTTTSVPHAHLCVGTEAPEAAVPLFFCRRYVESTKPFQVLGFVNKI